ncbi:hypothetical protein BCR34DRAFT_555342 [Clohesyomyces aquaticus]|uniref:Uncharacterized protein n=1 Tax=Clohesyomyces aquaticus TaxID=1231657 RepID=A0A1Y2A5C5_9PLEO|nr:hypothetical protein BCR34DRAFT_555342 [Clohesyomyces aquaticus]
MTRHVSVLSFVAFVGFLVLPYVHALEFTNGSPCEDLCKSPKSSTGDISYTLSSELSCLDPGYAGGNSTTIGRKFKSCVSCEFTSGMNNPTAENDLYWFLFNIKSTVVWCVQGFFGAEQNKAATLANSRCNLLVLRSSRLCKTR